jgi:hypothetical protein
MPRKVIAGNATMKAAGTVVKKLARWLVAKFDTTGHRLPRSERRSPPAIVDVRRDGFDDLRRRPLTQGVVSGRSTQALPTLDGAGPPSDTAALVLQRLPGR